MTRVFPSDTMDTRAALPVARPQCATPGCKGRPAYTDADGFRVCGVCFRTDRRERDPDGALRDEPTPVESAMPSKPRLITCIDCGKEKPLKAAGRCATCYDRDLKARQSASVESGIMPGPSGPPPSPVEAPVPPREEVPVVEAAPPASVEKVTEPLPAPVVDDVLVEPLAPTATADTDCDDDEGLGEPCEGCKAPAVTRDGMGVPLCGPCFDALPLVDDDAPTTPAACCADPDCEGDCRSGRVVPAEAPPATTTATADKDCDDAPRSGYATEARLRAERDRLQAEVVTLRGHVEHDYQLVADRPLGERILYRCARPGCGHESEAPVRAYFDGGCVVARVPDAREARIVDLERDAKRIHDLIGGDPVPAIVHIGRVLDAAGVPMLACNRGPECGSLHILSRIHTLADERDALRRRADRAEAELRTIREALGRHPAVDTKEVIADIGRLTSEAGGYGRATLAHRALRNDIAHALGYTDGAGSTPDGDLVDELARRLAQEPAQETITVRVTCPLGDRDEAPVPSDVRRERIVFGALVDSIEADLLYLSGTEQLGARRAGVLRALRALGGLEAAP